MCITAPVLCIAVVMQGLPGAYVIKFHGGCWKLQRSGSQPERAPGHQSLAAAPGPIGGTTGVGVVHGGARPWGWRMGAHTSRGCKARGRMRVRESFISIAYKMTEQPGRAI
ncbi:MAG: hypothetical protein J3K34DRAFT_397997 [Monoraphidium minutum]|nr:MAG: hypothetical protein J3K34DRAFT_397997 [Monoraphidium minutum]